MNTVPRPQGTPQHARPTLGLLRDVLGVLAEHGHQVVSGRDLALALPDLDAHLVGLVATATEPAGVASV
ncbi:hypothetical protein ACFW4K_26955 [Nocardiopsis alba]|uniref:hypothetical protein n=1 Tax=Nocardiopsis alba TaxID=53437 RepID=UPI00366F6528